MTEAIDIIICRCFSATNNTDVHNEKYKEHRETDSWKDKQTKERPRNRQTDKQDRQAKESQRET